MSAASNIAEGYGRSTKGEYVLFLGHARGSNCELQTQLIIAKDPGMESGPGFDAAQGLSIDVGRMLLVLMKKLHE